MSALRAAIYVRVSTTNQEAEGTSLESQERLCRAYAEKHGYTVLELYRDVHTGAEYRERPALSAMRESIRNKAFDVVVAYAIDRLSRNQAHLYILAEEASDNGARVEFVTEDFEDSAIGRFLRSAKAFAAEVEREKIAERTMRGKQSRAREGKLLPAARPRYGYRWRDATKGQYDVNPDTAPIVQRIFREAVVGVPLRVIARGLTADGIPTPSGRSSAWSHTVVREILQYPNYTGNAVAWAWRRVPQRKTMMRYTPDEAIALPDGTVPALVDQETWNSVQAIMQRNQAQASRNNRAPRLTLLRGGYLTCGHCGRTMHVTRQRKSMLNGREPKSLYMCSGAGSHVNPCGTHSMLAETLDAAVWDRVRAILTTPDTISRELERLQTDDPTEGQLETVDRQIADVVRRQTNLMRQMSALDDPELAEPLREVLTDLSRRRRDLDAERDSLLGQRAAWEHAHQNLDALSHWRETVAHNLDDLGYDERRLALDALGITAKLYRSDHNPRYEITANIPLSGPITYNTPCNTFRLPM